MSPDEILEEAAALFKNRNEDYGNSYKTFGDFVFELFPYGLTLRTPQDFARWGVFNMILSKIHRYSYNIKYGHSDSLKDLSVYAAMLLELDEEHNVSNSD